MAELAVPQKEKIINYLKTHPEGVTRIQAAKALNIDGKVFHKIISCVSLPIAFDSDIDGKYYWIGV